MTPETGRAEPQTPPGTAPGALSARPAPGGGPAPGRQSRTAGLEPAEVALFVALGTAWGSSYLFIRIGVETLPPLSLVVGRVALGFLILVVTIVATRTRLPREARVYRHLLVMGVLNIALPFWLISWAEQRIDSGLAGILNATVPFFTLLLAGSFIHDERITLGRLAGIAIGFAGIVVISLRDLGSADDAGGQQLLGILAMTASSFFYGAGNTYARRMLRGTPSRVQAIGQVGGGLLIVTILALVVDHGITLPATPEAVFAVAWLGVVGSGFAYLIYFRLLTSWGPTRTSMVAYLLPVVAVLLGVAVRGETVDARYLVGGILVLAGIMVVNRRR